MVAEDARCDGSVAASGSAEVVECELRRPAVADEQSRLMRWRDSGQTGARLSAETCNAARCKYGRPGRDRGHRQAADCVLQRPRTRAVLWCGAALCGALRLKSQGWWTGK